MSSVGPDSKPLQLRVGLFGAASISRKVWKVIHCAGHRVVIVGSRDAQRGADFVKAMSETLAVIPHPSGEPYTAPRVGSYDDVVAADDVDVVYVPIPVTTRDPWIRACINAGKHVVGEKPPARTAKELQSWLDLAKEKKVLYMDGTMFTHGQRLARVKEAIASSRGGDVVRVETQVSFYPSWDPSFFERDIRMFPELEPHGALGDVGWYCMRWTLHVLDFAEPSSITRAVITKQCEKTKAIVGFEGSLEFAKGDGSTRSAAKAVFYCSMDDDLPHITRIFMADGTVITIPESVVPPKEMVPYFLIEKDCAAGEASDSLRVTYDDLKAYEERKGVEKCFVGGDETSGDYQTRQMWRNVAGALVTDVNVETGSPRRLVVDPVKAQMYAEYAFKTQKVIDALLVAAGEGRGGQQSA